MLKWGGLIAPFSYVFIRLLWSRFWHNLAWPLGGRTTLPILILDKWKEGGGDTVSKIRSHLNYAIAERPHGWRRGFVVVTGWDVHSLDLFYHSISAVPEYIVASSTKLNSRDGKKLVIWKKKADEEKNEKKASSKAKAPDLGIKMRVSVPLFPSFIFQAVFFPKKERKEKNKKRKKDLTCTAFDVIGPATK